VTRFLTPLGAPAPNGVITNPAFQGPFHGVFRNGELFIVNMNAGNILRYQFDAAGTALPNGLISSGLTTSVRGIVVTPWGELFASHCCDGSPVVRFTFDAAGNAAPNGSFNHPSLSGTHGMAFSSWGELFVANHSTNAVSRFTFDAARNAVFNGEITGNGLNGPLALAFSPSGELFVASHNAGIVSRWTFDPSRHPMANGAFATGGSGLVGIAFGPAAPAGSDLTGPVTSNVVVTPAGPLVASTPTVMAAVSDASTGGARIAMAQYQLDGGPLVVMSAADGAYDQTNESVTASFGPLAAGSHSICVRGTDAAGNAGAAVCASFSVTAASQARLLTSSSSISGTTNEVFRYLLMPTGAPALDLTLTHPSFDRPTTLTFSPSGELFVPNTPGANPGSVSRFLNPQGAPAFNGTISPPLVNAPLGATFRHGELFVTQIFSGSVGRVRFDPGGAPLPNGQITAGLVSAVSHVASAPWGELFVSQFCCTSTPILRYALDANGVATLAGAISHPSLSFPRGMAFGPWGELFAANYESHTVSRFTFDANGNAAHRGDITGNGLNGPLELAFSPWGELFVTSHNTPYISRWTFDASGNAFPNGGFATPGSGLSGIAFLPAGAPSLDTTPPPVSGVLAAPNPVAVNTAVTLTGTVSDAATGASVIAAAEYQIDGGPFLAMAAADGAFNQVAENVTVVVPGFASAGLRNLCVRGRDAAGNSGAVECLLLAVYDPSAGFVTGEGQVSSPAGADLPDPAAAGPALFVFVSRYNPGSTVPDGNLQFWFTAGNLRFRSIAMDFLVVTGQPRAIFRGDGLINNAQQCKFEVDAWDGSFQPGAVDAFGIKIYSCTGGGDRYRLDPKSLMRGNVIIHP